MRGSTPATTRSIAVDRAQQRALGRARGARQRHRHRCGRAPRDARAVQPRARRARDRRARASASASRSSRRSCAVTAASSRSRRCRARPRCRSGCAGGASRIAAGRRTRAHTARDRGEGRVVTDERILIVEDDEAIATGLSLNLKLAGRIASSARDGDEAIAPRERRGLRAHPARHQPTQAQRARGARRAARRRQPGAGDRAVRARRRVRQGRRAAARRG